MHGLSALSDRQLVALVQSTSNVQAFEELVRRHLAALTSFVRRLSSETVDADDVAQTSFHSAYIKIDQFEGRASFRTWLFQIAYRDCLKAKEKMNRQDRLSQSIAELGVDAFSKGHSDLVISQIDIAKGLATLNPDERATLLLCDVHGFTNQEAAQTLGIPLGTAKSFVRRARQRMRKFLETEHEG